MADEDVTQQGLDTSGIGTPPILPSFTQQDAPITGDLQAPPPPQVDAQLQAPPQAAPAVPPPRPPGTSSLGQYQGTKSQIFRSILGDFLYSAGKGMAAAGHGPESNARGAGEAMGALHDRDIEQQQLANQKAAIQATAALKAGQASQYDTEPVTLSNGQVVMMNSIAAAKVRQAQEQAAGRTATQETKNEGALATQGLKNTGAVQVAQIRAGSQSAFGKLTPEMAAIGMPPDPKDYSAGIKDPRFKQAVQQYGQDVTELKQKNALANTTARGMAFAYGRAKYMQVPVLDSDTQEMGFKTPLEIAASGNKYKPLAEADKQMMKNAVFEDIKGAAGKLRAATQANTDGFSAAQVAQMTAAMQADPSGGVLSSTISNLAHAGAKDSLTPKQQDQAIAMQQAYENAYALRGVAGMGSGSDQLRDAIRATLPGPSSPPGYALKQLTAFEQQVNRLHRGVPNMKLRNAGDTGAGSGDVVQTLIDRYKPKTQ